MLEISYTIYESKLPEVKKELKRIATKAKKYNVPFEYTVSEPHKEKVNIYNVDPVTGTCSQATSLSYYVDAVDVKICGDIVQQNGWEVLARVDSVNEDDPKEPKTVMLYGNEYDNGWHFVDCHCDHCGTNRRRKTIFICRNQSEGKTVQVGKTCLQDYTGISPLGLIDWASVRDIFNDERRFDNCDMGEVRSGSTRYFDVRDVIALAYKNVESSGYVKSEMANSTKNAVRDDISNHITPTAEAYAKADEIINWMGNVNPIGDLLWNAKILVNSKYVKDSMIGYLCYLPVAYEREMKRLNEIASNPSRHVGAIGDRIRIHVTEVKILTSYVSDYYPYNTVYKYRMVDEAGNIFIWSSAKQLDDRRCEIVGTVKNHTSFRGIEQTELTRCKVLL